ncbi:hypothetical protein PG987_000605 [Apiospora arundinis]
MVEKLERNNIKRLNEMQPFLEQQGIEIAVDLSPYAYYVIGRDGSSKSRARCSRLGSRRDQLRCRRDVYQGASVILGKRFFTAEGQTSDSGQQDVRIFDCQPYLLMHADISNRDKIDWSKQDFDAIAARFQGLECLPSQ